MKTYTINDATFSKDVKCPYPMKECICHNLKLVLIDDVKDMLKFFQTINDRRLLDVAIQTRLLELETYR